MKLLCPAGEREPVLLEPDGSLAATSPQPRWFRALMRELEADWGMPLLQLVEDSDPLALDALGFEAWVHCRQTLERPLEIAPGLAF